jgi:hypothetical protein
VPRRRRAHAGHRVARPRDEAPRAHPRAPVTWSATARSPTREPGPAATSRLASLRGCDSSPRACSSRSRRPRRIAAGQPLRRPFRP